jgi:hypothetical protein
MRSVSFIVSQFIPYNLEKNLNLSPSRRKLPTTNSQSTDKIFTSLNAVLCDLKPITDYSIQLAQPVHFKSQ